MQRFPGYNTKSMIREGKSVKFYFINIKKTFFLGKKLRERKDKPQSGRKYLQIIYLINLMKSSISSLSGVIQLWQSFFVCYGIVYGMYTECL